ncbi:MAG: glycosyltransferase family 39 protein, partial [bacterium]|nr:glycosyltransferase family 39 protein [bacterium]
MALVLTERLTKFLAILFLAAMFSLAFLSMKDDALTFDELAHIPAGYSYLTKQDYRINPEHPPLAKDLAALPLLFLNLNFPEQSQNWLQDAGAPPWWVQFDLGTEFLYQSGNDPQEIIVWSRIPMIFLLLALGWLLFTWTRSLAGNGPALLALFLFSLSPTLLAHGRLVTTDVAAAFGAVLSLLFWVRFLKEPTKKHVLYAGIAFGVAMLLKFSLILLVPVFVLLTVLYPFLSGFSLRKLTSYVSKAFL